jgi:hypothetical protein
MVKDYNRVVEVQSKCRRQSLRSLKLKEKKKRKRIGLKNNGIRFLRIRKRKRQKRKKRRFWEQMIWNLKRHLLVMIS